MKLNCVRGRQQEYDNPATKRRYWSNSEVLHVLDSKAFVGVDPLVMEAAQDRGNDLHFLFGLRLLSLRGIGQKPERPHGIIGDYYDGIERFVKERKPIPEKVEESSINERDGYAGTPDTQCWLDGVSSELWLIDLKTGDERAVHSAQLVGGYKYLDGYEKSTRFASLYIRKNGTYKLAEHTHNHIDRAWFLGGLTVLNGRRYHHIK